MRHGVAILTCVPDGARSEVRRRLPAALASLERSGYPGPVFVIDDGSADAEHRAFLRSLRHPVIVRESNGGVPRGKNTCIRLLMEHGVDVGFLADDDVEFRPGWHLPYLEAHARTGIEHFSWAWDEDPSGRMRKVRRRVSGFEIVRTSLVNGVLLTFTPRVVERVGGFRILPGRWGHTNTNWTRRILHAGLAPYFCDVVDSNRWIGLNEHSAHSVVSDAEKVRWEHENDAPAREVEPVYQALLE